MTQEFKVGDSDPYIGKIQRMLNQECGLHLKCDGGFGPITRDAIVTYQNKKFIKATGTYSAPTAALMDPLIAAKYLNDLSWGPAAAALSVPIASVKAVQQVETSGSGFLDDGRSQILFERHVFRRQLMAFMGKSVMNAMAVAKAAGMNYQPGATTLNVIDGWLQANWSDVYNQSAGGYSGGAKEYDRMAKAAKLDLPSAQCSASWGLFQIMGYQYAILGYPNVAAYVADAQTSETLHLQQFVKFILADAHLLGCLRTRDWHGFAVGYNGQGQQGYDTRLQQAAFYWDHH